MQPWSTFNAVACRVIFKGYSLSERYLQEQGVSPQGTFPLQKYALIPAIVWSAIFIRSKDISYIIHSPQLLLFFIAIAVTWNIQQFISSYISNSTSTISARETLSYLLLLPQLLLIGAVFNHDTPTIYGIVAIVILSLAFILQPAHHQDNKRKRFALPLFLIMVLIVIQASLDAINAGICRQALKTVSPEVFIGVFAITTMGLCWVWTAFLPKRSEDTQILQKRRSLAAIIPITWFVGTIPEIFAVAAIPIYTLFSIGAITFAIDTASDVFHHRIRFNLRTASFLGLVFIGIGLAAYST
jgi:hypothetical protein